MPKRHFLVLTSTLLLCLSLSACGGGAAAAPAATQPPAQPPAQPTGTLIPDYNTNPLPADASGMPSNAVQLASKIRVGWNLGNTLEASGGETAWGNPRTTLELIQLVKRNGFNAIRLPVAWNQYADQATGKISAAWLDRVKEVVTMAVDSDLYVIVNIHWDGGWLENNLTPDKQAAVGAKQKAFWQQIATHLRAFDERLLFASANEPNADDAAMMGVLMAHHQTFVDAVRASGGRNAHRVLIVQGPHTDIEKTSRLMSGLPRDTVAGRMMAEVHFYPFQFTLMDKEESWGRPVYYWGAGYDSATDAAHNATQNEEAWVDQMFALMKAKFVDQGIPVVLGEYGAIRRDSLTGDNLTLHLASRAHYLNYVTRRARASGMLPFYWDAGNLGDKTMSLFDRRALTVYDRQALDAVIQGAGGG